MNQIDISIITPCYNSGEYLPEAIESVRTYNGKYNYEIVLIDDGSTDEFTLNVLKNYQNSPDIVVIRQVNSGAATARNAACRIAKGEFLLFLDSDNKIFLEYIDLGIEFLSKNPDFGVFYGKPKFFGDGSRDSYEVSKFDIDKLLTGNYIDVCAVVRKEAWISVGGFDSNFRNFEDYDLWLSLAEKGWKFHFLDKELYQYRIVKTSKLGSGKQIFFNETARQIRTKHYDLWLSRFIEMKHQNDKMRKSPEMRIGKFLLVPLRNIRKFMLKK
ncbi:MAG: glycosyltransferase [Paludibacter sp.]|nr:glycosyltransferase [Paludibacter sp.]